MATGVRTKLRFEAIPDPDDEESWRVEAIDFEGEGICFLTTFLGHAAEERAKEYAEWKTGLDHTIEETAVRPT